MNGLSHKELFLLDPSITFLNFGSFGACAREIFEDYQNWQLQLEREPIQFFAKRGLEYLELSRESLGKYIGCHRDDLVFTTNPSYAMNIVAKSLRLQPGDEILTTDIEYGAMDKIWNYYSEQKKFLYKRQHISLPLKSEEDFITQFWNGLTPKTKVVFIGQITSATALKLPVEAICKKAKELGLITIIDGAHVPGQIPIDLSQLEADIYTGACHKWMLTPKGCSFLYVKKELQEQFDPLVISWGYKSATPSHSQFLDYHQQQGTRDYSAFLTVPKAIQFLEKYNWDIVSKNCRKLVRDNIQRFCDLLGSHPLAPIDESFFVQMCSLPIQTKNAIELKEVLYNHHKIEIPVMVHNEQPYIRFSINAFNTQEDLDHLYSALTEEIKQERIVPFT